jgi:hypothetical protein
MEVLSRRKLFPITGQLREGKLRSAVSKVLLICTWIVTGAISAVCLLAIPLWMFGIPGIENEYARGWRLGFFTIIAYPGLWASAFVAYLPLHLVTRTKLTAASQAKLNVAISVIHLTLLGGAAIFIWLAFTIMLSQGL